MSEFVPTPRSRVQHKPERATYDRDTIYAILDEGLVAHVGFVDDGRPCVIPVNYARDGERLLLHGAHHSRLVRTLAGGAPLCLTVTLIDGLVFGRAPGHISMNYRSVVVLGHAEEITDATEKLAALTAFVEHFVPGQGSETQHVDPAMLNATAVLAIPLDEASAKIRTGPIREDDECVDATRWAGEIPLRLAALPPVAIPGHPTPNALPAYLAPLQRVGLLQVQTS